MLSGFGKLKRFFHQVNESERENARTGATLQPEHRADADAGRTSRREERHQTVVTKNRPRFAFQDTQSDTRQTLGGDTQTGRLSSGLKAG